MNKFMLVGIASMTWLSQAAWAADGGACPSQGYAPAEYRIYVDPPSGDAYIRTPCGWRFIRTIEPQRIAEAIRMARLEAADLAREDTAADRSDR